MSIVFDGIKISDEIKKKVDKQFKEIDAMHEFIQVQLIYAYHIQNSWSFLKENK